MHKHKLLFIVGSLHQAGAERFAYEIDMALNKDTFEVSILCLEQASQISQNWSHRYYEPKHLALGTSIKYLDAFLNDVSENLFEKTINKLTKNKFKRKKFRWKPSFYHYLETFDVIHWMGEYTVIHNLPESIKKKSLINIMTAKFQDASLYKNFDFKYPYHFISGFKDDEQVFEFNQFTNLRHTYFPLVLKINPKKNTWRFAESTIKKIAIFTRLDRYKPLDPFFYSFQLLLDKLPNCELHIFGNGDPVQEGMLNFLERLAITNHVFFRGHQQDIVQTLNNEHIDLSWFQGYNNDRPAGYAGFDVCLAGTPLICWDFFPKPVKPFNAVYPHYKNLNQFVNHSIELLTNRHKAEKLSEAQFIEVSSSRNSQILIKTLEEAYQKIAVN